MANNILLGGQGAIGPHLDGCFCTTCRDRKVNALLSRRNVSLEMLHRVYVTSLTRSQEELLDVQFEFTKEEIIIGYCYKIKCLQGTGYTNFGSWLANTNNPTIANVLPPDREKICEKIGHVTTVYERWETIVENLSMPSMQILDARRFSIYQLSRAVCINWCVRTRNNMLQRRGLVPPNGYYDQTKFQQIMALVVSTGILDDVSKCREQAKIMADQFRKEILELCRRR